MAESTLLFIHQNFPAQYLHVAAALGRTGKHRVIALGEVGNVKSRTRIPGVHLWGYPQPRPAAPTTHRFVRPLESAVHRAEIIARACNDLKKRGIVPDVVCAHPGWGESLFVKDAFPDTHLRLYCEFFYRGQGADVGFDPEHPSPPEDQMRVRVKNAAILISLAGCDSAIAPTQWQRDVHPQQFHQYIEVAHDGVDTDLLTPDSGASLRISDELTLTAGDEVVTYVARNLEPYRGFHVFMRALPEIQRRRPNAHVVIVGDDGVSYGTPLPNGRTYKQKLLEELGDAIDRSRVHFLGRLPYSTLIRMYQISSAHIYLTYPFVLSWSMLEAMSAGCMVVASRTAPVEEVIEDGRNGRLVNFFDGTELASRIDEALAQSPQIMTIRAQARQDVIDRYDLKRICLPAQVNRIEELISRL